MSAKLDVRALDAWYGRAQILFEMTLSVAAHEAVALVGRNGAGKSTTLRAIMGLTARRATTLAFDGADISREPPYEIARRGLGFVPEDRRIFTELTVEENLEVGRRPARAGAPSWTTDKLYALFPNLGEMRKRLGGRMSGGEQQMLTIARTLMGNPSLVLLDEPSEGLAPRIVEDLAAALLELKREGLALLLSEQNLHFARLIADRVVIVEKGRAVFEGALTDFDAHADARDAYLAV